MHLTDQREIRADAATIWAAILDPEVLRQCVPGCESMTGTAESGFEAAVVQKVGPVKARFTGKVSLTDRVEPHSLTLSGEGSGGVAGFAKGEARVRLEPAAEGTVLHYEVQANVGGKLAQLGSRIIDGFARKMADDFFARFQAAVEGPDALPPGEEPAPDAPKAGWFKRMLGRD
jgi:carbon monoxide dehydrogenase subunit G